MTQYTTPEKVRVRSGFQDRFNKIPIKTVPDSTKTKLYIDTYAYQNFVPEFGTGSTTAGISDVKIYCGMSGADGLSVMTVTAISQLDGAITVNTAPTTGASIVATYTSSAIPDSDVMTVINEASNVIQNKLGQCYSLPLTTVPSSIQRLTTELASAMLLIRNYGVQDTESAQDGYALYDRLMGNTSDIKDDNGGEINKICSTGWQMYDDDGTLIPRSDIDLGVNTSFVSGGRVNGRVFDITEERFRKKPFQADVNQEQGGSGNDYPN